MSQSSHPANRPSGPADPATKARKVVQLARWRKTRGLAIEEALEQLQAHTGERYSYQAWWRWENGLAIPGADIMSGIFQMTGGKVRADHFYHLVRSSAAGERNAA